MVKNIAVFGATGFTGLNVVNSLIEHGFHVSVLSLQTEVDKEILPAEVTVVEGNWMYHRDLKKFLSQVDAVYCSLSVDLHEKPEEFHAETDGLREIIYVANECGIKRIAYMSSILQYNQVENDDLWWVFNVKKDAVNYVRDCGMPFTIFYPSAFMESFNTIYRKGNKIQLIGQSRFPIYFISVKDYANMVAKSFKILKTEDREYFLQGTDCFKMEEAAKLFIKHHTQDKLKLKILPYFMAKVYALIDSAWKFKMELAEAQNNNTEMFVSEDTWEELGKPEITFNAYTKHA